MQGSRPAANDLTHILERTKSSESDLVYKGNLTYRIDNDRMIYATYSEGFRSGGGNGVRPQSVLPRAYDSDFLTNYELGAKTTWLSHRLRLNAAAYHMIWKNIQIQVEDPQPTVFSLGTVNVGEAQIDGVELNVALLVGANWELSGSLAWTDARLSRSFDEFGIVAEKGTPLPITPNWKGSFGIEYHVPTTWFGAEPYVRADYSYNGKSVNSLAGVESVVLGSTASTLDAYGLLDLKFGLEGKGWSAALFLNNLTNELGEQNLNNRWGKQRVSYTAPRSFGITLRKSFR